MSILIYSLIGIGAVLCAWTIYGVGYNAGYHDGRENEIDNTAARFARLNRNKL